MAYQKPYTLDRVVRILLSVGILACVIWLIGYLSDVLISFAGMLLSPMDKKTRKLGIKTAYTIAKAASHGMNSVFKNSRYNYAGL